jgi:hypothetical protein
VFDTASECVKYVIHASSPVTNALQPLKYVGICLVDMFDMLHECVKYVMYASEPVINT